MKPDTEQCKDCIDFCEVTLTEIAFALERGEPWSEFWCAMQATELRSGDRPQDLDCEIPQKGGVMADILSTDFPLEEIPTYPGKYGHSKYAGIRQALLDCGRVKLKVSNPDGLSLTTGEHEAGRIYQALRYWFKRRRKSILRGRIKGEVLWLWVDDQGKEE